MPRSHGAARVCRALPTALQAQPCHLVLRSSRPPDRASQSRLTVTRQQLYVVQEVPGVGRDPH